MTIETNDRINYRERMLKELKDGTFRVCTGPMDVSAFDPAVSQGRLLENRGTVYFQVEDLEGMLPGELAWLDYILEMHGNPFNASFSNGNNVRWHRYASNSWEYDVDSGKHETALDLLEEIYTKLTMPF